MPIFKREGFGPRSTLRFTFPLNKSDDTIGWNGRITGYSVYYSHFQDSMVEQKHSILITPKLTPIVSLQNVKRTFLGKPFTNCHQTNATNRWEYDVNKTIYKEYKCLYEVLMRNIVRQCGCYPSYVSELVHLIPDTVKTSSPCNFFEHAVCVSSIISHYEWTDPECLPACTSYSFHQESIQYADMFQENGVSDTTMLIRLSEKINVIYNELPSYSYAEVLSDVGGAAGLILGLNLWLIIQVLSNCMDVSIIKARQKINEFANHCQEIGNEKVCFRDHLFARIQRMVDRRRLTQDPRSTRLNSTASGLLPASEVSPDTGYGSDDYTVEYCKTKSKINSIV